MAESDPNHTLREAGRSRGPRALIESAENFGSVRYFPSAKRPSVVRTKSFRSNKLVWLLRGCLALSLIPLSLAIYGTVTGTAVLKSAKIERSKNPIQYWLLLALEYGLFALLVIIAISNISS